MSVTDIDTRNDHSKTSWFRLSWGIRLTIALTGSAIAWWGQIHWSGGVSIPAGSSTSGVALLIALPFLCSVMGIMLPLWALLLITERLTSAGTWGKILSSVLLLSFSGWIVNALLSNWLGRTPSSGSLRWMILIALAVVILLIPLPIMRMKRKAVALVAQGDYDGALRISRVWLRSKVYGRPFQGWIMLQAGRSVEALELLRDSAFDQKGKPLLTTLHLYFYALTLMNEERYSEAQPLLEAAVQVRQKLQESFRFSLAECLLSQNKEANRAFELAEQLVANRNRNSSSIRERFFMAQCASLRAWALASSGRREEAQASLDRDLLDSNSFGKEDLAGLLFLRGQTWKALDDRKAACEAYKQALVLFPFGINAVLARNALVRLGENDDE